MQGRQTEKQIVPKRGGKVHPNSGAGKIKDDGSSADELFEVKDANKTHTLNALELKKLWQRAVRQGKEAHYIIYFRSIDMTCTLTMRRGKG